MLTPCELRIVVAVPAPRHSSLRGSIARGEPGRTSVKTPPRTPIHVADPCAPRNRIDYALQRRAAIVHLHTGGALTSDYCEADYYLLKAAAHHGVATTDRCPACKRENLVRLNYVYGDELGPYAGRIRTTEELQSMATKFGEFRVYVVEVCQRCHWNFMVSRYELGDGTPRSPLPQPRGEVI